MRWITRLPEGKRRGVLHHQSSSAVSDERCSVNERMAVQTGVYSRRPRSRTLGSCSIQTTGEMAKRLEDLRPHRTMLPAADSRAIELGYRFELHRRACYPDLLGSPKLLLRDIIFDPNHTLLMNELQDHIPVIPLRIKGPRRGVLITPFAITNTLEAAPSVTYPSRRSMLSAAPLSTAS